MARRMTVVFDDEELYTALKVEAVRSRRPAKDIVAEAVQAWLASLSRDRARPLDGRTAVVREEAEVR